MADHTLQPLDPRRWLILVITSCAALMGTLDVFIVNVAVPSIERSLQASFGDVQLVVAGYTLAYATLLIPGGRMGDLYGRKRLFMGGVGGFTLLSFLCGVAPTAGWLILFRIGKGAMAALMTPQVISFIQVSFPLDERPRAFSIYATINGLAAVLGQVIGGWLITANFFDLGWRTVFLVNVPVGMAVLLIATVLLRESRRSGAHRPDYGGMILLTASLFLFIFPLVQGGGTGWPVWARISLLLSMLGASAFLSWEQRISGQGRTPLLPLALFKVPRFTGGIVTVMLAASLFAALLFLLTFYLQTILGLSPMEAGLVFMSEAVAFVLASSLSPAVASRLGNRSLVGAATLVGLGHLLILLAVHVLVPLWGPVPLPVALSISGLGMGFLMTQLMPKTVEYVAHEDTGAAAGVYTTATQLAAALGVAVIGLVFTALTEILGSALPAFIGALLIISLLSLGLFFTILPLNRTYQREIEGNPDPGCNRGRACESRAVP